MTAASDRASSSFDVRHNFTASLVWQNKNWKVAAIARARSGFPIDVLAAENLLGLSFDDATRPDLVAGVPIWIADPHVLGGRRLNPAAFAVPVGTLQGNLGRNAIGGFGFYQVDLAVSRGFRLGEQGHLELRADAYNALNHAMPGDPVPYLDSPLFGASNAGLNAVLGMGSPHSGLRQASRWAARALYNSPSDSHSDVPRTRRSAPPGAPLQLTLRVRRPLQRSASTIELAGFRASYFTETEARAERSCGIYCFSSAMSWEAVYSIPRTS